MKPGSSDRCTVKNGGKTPLRCHLRKGHEGSHQAPRGNQTVRWTVITRADAERFFAANPDPR